MKQLDFPVRIIIPHIRPLQNEHHGTKACNDADSRRTLRTSVHRIYLAASLYPTFRIESLIWMHFYR